MGNKHSAKLGAYTIIVEEGQRLADNGRQYTYVHVGWKRNDEVIEILPFLYEIRTAALIFFKEESKFAGLTFEEFIKALFDDEHFQ